MRELLYAAVEPQDDKFGIPRSVPIIIQDHIREALALLGEPRNREEGLTRTKLEEALLWHEKGRLEP